MFVSPDLVVNDALQPLKTMRIELWRWSLCFDEDHARYLHVHYYCAVHVVFLQT